MDYEIAAFILCALATATRSTRLSIRAGLQRLSVALYHFLLTVAGRIRDAADYWSILSVGLGVDRLQRSFGLPRIRLLAALFFPSEPVIA